MKQLTVQYGNNPAVPIGFDLDFVSSLDEATWKGIDAIIQRLSAYEKTGLTLEEITAMKSGRDTLKSQLRHFKGIKEQLQSFANEQGAQINTLKKALEDRLSELKATCGGDETETYTSGYRTGHRNGQIELIKWALKIPDGATQEQEGKKCK